jgi:hypothetical protein
MPRQTIFRDLHRPWLMYLKAALLLAISLLAAALIFLNQPTLRTAALLAIAIWAACRAYYFAFYVIQHYVDPQYHFSGLISFLRYLLRKPQGPRL